MRRTTFWSVRLLILCCGLSTITAVAQVTIHVPADQATIQSGIDAAQSGDTVLVAPGTYNERIDFKGKNITVTSSGGAAQTIIDGQQGGSVVYFHNSETNAAVLYGFTIQNGKAVYGAGVDIESASPTVEHNVITGNGCGTGGGVYVGFASPIVRYNTIHHNNRAANCYPSGIGGGGITIGGAGQAQILYNLIYENKGGYEGGGIGMWAAGQALVEGNIIRNNYSTGSAGGGMSIENEGSSIVRNNVIVNNYGGGVEWGRMPGDFSNNTVAGNSSLPNTVELAAFSWWDGIFRNNLIVATTGAPAIQCENSTTYGITAANFTYNNVYSNGGSAYSCPAQTGANNNISVDPQFANPAAGNYHLSTGSPVIDVANGAITLPATDADMNARVVAAAGGTALPDLGAYEYQGTTTMSVSTTALSFADQKTNTSSAAQAVTITNTGTVALHLKHIDIGSDFQQTNDCETPDGLAAGKTCTISVVFLPLTGGNKAESMTLIADDAAGTPHGVSLSGNGIGPEISFSPTSLPFTPQSVNTISNAQTVTVTNTGGYNLIISAVQVTGDYVIQSNGCAGTIAPAATCQVAVQFLPTLSGARLGSIAFNDNASASPQTVSLSGQGTAPLLQVTPFSFTTAIANVTTSTTLYLLKNVGNETLVVASLGTTGDFSLTNNCNTVTPGKTCGLILVFAPTAAGVRTGTLTITSNAPGSPITLNLSATALASYPVPVLSAISPASVAITASDTPIRVTGSDFYPGTTVLLDGQALSTTFNSNGQIGATIPATATATYGEHKISVMSPTPGGGVSTSILPFLVFRPVSISARDMAYDRYRRVFYATVTGGSSQNPNSVVAIDPETGSAVKVTDLGSEGRKLAISEDGQYLYVGMGTAYEIKRINLRTGLIDLTINLGSGNYALDIVPLKETPGSIAVVYGDYINPGWVGIFDGGVKRANVYSLFNAYYAAIASDPSLLYVGSTYGDFSQLKIDSSGVSPVTTKYQGGPGPLYTDGNWLFSANNIYDPSTMAKKGSFTFSNGPYYGWSVYPERGTDRVYLGNMVYGYGEYDAAIWAGTVSTFTTSGPVLVPLPAGSTTQPLTVSRWKSNGLAYRIYSGATNVGGTYSTDQIVFLRSSLTNPSAGTNPTPTIANLNPASARVGTFNTVVTITGSGFVPGTYALWNGDERSAEYVDATHVKIFLPASDFAASGTAQLAVVNPAAGGGTSNQASFAIVPSGPIAQFATIPLSFGNQLINTVSAAQTVALSNTGTDPLLISSIGASGAFSQTNNCGTSVAAGASCTITVTFAPKAAGAATGTLTITHNAAGGPGTVSLSGKGTDFVLSGGSGGSASSQTVTAGQPATFNLSIAGSDGFAGTAALTCNGAPALSTCTINPTSVTLNGTAPAPFTVTITTTGRSAGFQAPSGSGGSIPPYIFGLGAMMALLLAMKNRQPRLRSAAALASILMTVIFSSCGGGGGTTTTQTTTSSGGTPTGTYTVVVSATSGTATRTMNLTVTVN